MRPIIVAFLLAIAPIPAKANDALVVHITCINAKGQTSTGSGVLTSPTGHVLTAAHVAPDGYTCTGAIGGLKAPTHPLTALHKSENFDGMVMKFDHPSAQNRPHATYCKMGEHMKTRAIRVYGFHQRSPNEPPVTDGIISTYNLDKKGMFETTAETVHGKSGGPAFLTGTTALIGIVGGVNFNSVSEPIGYMVTPADKLARIARLTPAETCDQINKYDLKTHEQLLDEKFEDLLSQINSGNPAQLALLRAQLAEVERQKSDLEASFKAREEELRQLRLQLDAFKNGTIPNEKLEAAQEALYRGETDLADEIFEEIEEAEAQAVKRVAAAAYGRGRIAEDEIRWADAAKHYAKAARLDPTYDHLHAASGLSWLSGDYSGGLRYSADLIAAAKRKFGENTSEHATALNQQALSLQAAGQYDQAETQYREAIRIGKIANEEGDRDNAAHLNNLADLLRSTGRYAEAEPLYRDALRIGEKMGDKDHPTYATRLNNLALLLADTDRYAEAEPLYREAMRITGAALGKEHPNYATRLSNLAGLLSDVGRFEEAEPLYREALRIDEKVLGKQHPSYANGLNNLAEFLRTQERYAEAEPLYREVNAVNNATLGHDHPHYAVGLNNLAALLASTGRFAEAEPLYREAISVWESSLGPDHPWTNSGQKNLEILLDAMKNQ